MSSKSIPSEDINSVLIGNFMHLGFPALYVLVVYVLGISIPNVIFGFLSVTSINFMLIMYLERKYPSVNLPPPTNREVLEDWSLSANYLHKHNFLLPIKKENSYSNQ